MSHNINQDTKKEKKKKMNNYNMPVRFLLIVFVPRLKKFTIELIHQAG